MLSPFSGVGSISSNDGKLEPKPHFRTLEQVAPEIGLAKSRVRDFAGMHTRAGNRIMLTHDDVVKLVIWIQEQAAKEDRRWDEPENDPFA